MRHRITNSEKELLSELIAGLGRLPALTPGLSVDVELCAENRFPGISGFEISDRSLEISAGTVSSGDMGSDYEQCLQWIFTIASEPDRTGDFECDFFLHFAAYDPGEMGMSLEGALEAQKCDITSALRSNLGPDMRPEVDHLVFWQTSDACHFEVQTRERGSTERACHFQVIDYILGIEPEKSIEENVYSFTQMDAKSFRMSGTGDPWLLRDSVE